MKLSADDVELFYKLMWRLQFTVNQQLEIAPGIDNLDQYTKAPQDVKMAVRNALFDNPELIDAFVRDNPFDLPGGELTIVGSWRGFVRGDFYIERFLKNHSIWIGGEPSKVYAVLGLYDSLKDMFHGLPLPIMVKGVLLPFKGQIIYDGLLNVYSVYFGSGIRGDLRKNYLAAKQNRRIITSLETAAPPEGLPDKPGRDWKPQVDAIATEAAKLRGEKAPIPAAVFSVVKAAADLAQAAINDPGDIEALWKQYNNVNRSLNKVYRVLERAER